MEPNVRPDRAAIRQLGTLLDDDELAPGSWCVGEALVGGNQRTAQGLGQSDVARVIGRHVVT